MDELDNKDVCGGKNGNVGYYYKVAFPVKWNNSRYSFNLSVDFSNGGILLGDGHLIEYKNNFEGHNQLIYHDVILNKGMHVIEFYGSAKDFNMTKRW